MIELYITTNIIYSYFFIFRVRLFDLFSLAYLSSIVYFLPALYGIDIWGVALHENVYIVFMLVQFYIFLFAILYNNFIIKFAIPKLFNAPKITYQILFLIGLFVIAVVIYYGGITVFFKDKSEMNLPSSLSIFWRISGTLLLLYGYLLTDRKLFYSGFFILLLTFIAHDRTATALSFLALFLLFSKEPISLLKKYFKYIPIILFFVVLMMFGKLFHAMVHIINSGGTYHDALSIILRINDFTKLITTTEPFVIQLILNKIISQDFIIKTDYLYDLPLYLLPVTSIFGVDSAVFNDIIQSEIFTQFKSRSIAYNFWAEGYANGGWVMLNFFIIIWCIGIVFLNHLIKTNSLFFKGLASIMGAYWVFYIHRNSLFSIITYERHFFYFSIILLIIGILVQNFILKGRQ